MPQQRSRERPGDRRALQSVSMQFFANGVVYASFIPQLPEIRDRVGISIGALGFVLTLASISGLIGRLLTGRVIAKLGTRRVVIIGTIMSIGSLPVVGFATTPAMLIVGLVGLLFFDVFIDVAMNVQGSVLSARRRTPVMNRLHGLWSLGGVAGAIMTVLANRADISVSVHLAVVTRRADRRVAVRRAGPAAGRRAARARRRVEPVGEGLHGSEVMATEEVENAIRHRRFGAAAVVLAIGGATAMLLEVGNGDWAAFRLSVDFDSSAGVASAAFLLFTVGMTIGRLGGDWVQVRIGSMQLRRLGLVVAGVGSVLATLVPVEGVSIVGFLIAGLGTSVLFPQLYDQAARLPGPPGSGFAAHVDRPALHGDRRAARHRHVGEHRPVQRRRCDGRPADPAGDRRPRHHLHHDQTPPHRPTPLPETGLNSVDQRHVLTQFRERDRTDWNIVRKSWSEG